MYIDIYIVWPYTLYIETTTKRESKMINLDKIFKNTKQAFFRAGADTISETTSRKAKKILKEVLEENGELEEAFSVVGETVFIDSPSWVQYRK